MVKMKQNDGQTYILLSILFNVCEMGGGGHENTECKHKFLNHLYLFYCFVALAEISSRFTDPSTGFSPKQSGFDFWKLQELLSDMMMPSYQKDNRGFPQTLYLSSFSYRVHKFYFCAIYITSCWKKEFQNHYILVISDYILHVLTFNL